MRYIHSHQLHIDQPCNPLKLLINQDKEATQILTNQYNEYKNHLKCSKHFKGIQTKAFVGQTMTRTRSILQEQIYHLTALKKDQETRG